jgi:hypothetical protein
MREANMRIKIYPKRIIFELPKIDEMYHIIKTVEVHGTNYIIADLKGKVGCTLAENKNTVVNIGDVESPGTRDRATGSNTTRGGT